VIAELMQATTHPDLAPARKPEGVEKKRARAVAIDSLCQTGCALLQRQTLDSSEESGGAEPSGDNTHADRCSLIALVCR
jgi:hypothetical protein